MIIELVRYGTELSHDEVVNRFQDRVDATEPSLASCGSTTSTTWGATTSAAYRLGIPRGVTNWREGKLAETLAAAYHVTDSPNSEESEVLLVLHGQSGPSLTSAACARAWGTPGYAVGCGTLPMSVHPRSVGDAPGTVDVHFSLVPVRTGCSPPFSGGRRRMELCDPPPLSARRPRRVQQGACWIQPDAAAESPRSGNRNTRPMAAYAARVVLPRQPTARGRTRAPGRPDPATTSSPARRPGHRRRARKAGEHVTMARRLGEPDARSAPRVPAGATRPDRSPPIVTDQLMDKAAGTHDCRVAMVRNFHRPRRRLGIQSDAGSAVGS